MSKTSTEDERIDTVFDLAVSYEEAIVVCTEYRESDTEGNSSARFLIAPKFTACDDCSGLILNSAIYLCNSQSEQNKAGTAFLKRVLISEKDHWWTAIDTDLIGMIPRPSRKPYPVKYISNHGFQWMDKTICAGNRSKVWKHLHSRFQGQVKEESKAAKKWDSIDVVTVEDWDGRASS